MSAAEKKPAKKTTKPDVDRPGKSAPSATSKPVIVSNRPLLKDPMVVDEDAALEEETTEKEELAHSLGPKIQPLNEPDQPEPEPEAADEPPAEEPAEKKTPPAEPEAADEEDTPAKTEAKSKKKDETEAAEQAKHAADVQKLIDSGQYVLPINAVEKRKAKHFVVLGVFLAILLALAWADIAMDAGLVHVNGVQPVTHFFSN